MKTIRSVCTVFVSLLLLVQSVGAHRDEPLNWKIQQWQFVVIVQAGGRMTNNGQIHVEKKVVKILRGKQEDLPEIKLWQHNDVKKGQYYLLTYFNYQVPLMGAEWGDRFQVEKTNDSFVINAIQDNQTNTFSSENAVYGDLPLQKLENLLKAVPFEPNPTNTFHYKAGHHSK